MERAQRRLQPHLLGPTPTPTPTPSPTPAPVTKGTLNVVVDTSAAGCTGTTTCSGLGVTVRDPASGDILSFFTVPPASLGELIPKQLLIYLLVVMLLQDRQ